jgi:hypothetical protein
LQRSDIITSLACELVSALSFKSPENQSKLGQAGACKAILQTLELIVLRTDPTNGHFSRKNASFTVLDTMKDMMASAVFVSGAGLGHASVDALPEMAQTLPGSSAAPVRSDGSSPSGLQQRSTIVLIEDCLAALLGLAAGHDANRGKLVSLGALDLLSEILNAQSLGDAVRDRARACLEVLA